MRLRLLIIAVIMISAVGAGLLLMRGPAAVPVSTVSPPDMRPDCEQPLPPAVEHSPEDEPSPPPYPEIRGLYMPAAMAQDPDVLAGFVAYARDMGFTAVVADVKDDCGLVSEGAAIASVVRAAGLVPIARIVVFSDPIAAGLNPQQAVRTAEGEWVDPAGRVWLDASLPETREALVALATLAVEWGFEEIHFDRAHFPDLRLAGWDSPDEQARISIVAEFLSAAKISGARSISAGLAGVSTGAYGDLGSGQDLVAAASAADFVSPRLILSELDIPGLYGLEDPLAQWDVTVTHALAEAAVRLGETAKLRPWIEDPGDSALTQAVIAAAHDAGVGSWILYRADGRYTPGVDPNAAASPQPLPGPAAGLPPNELGRVMILMYHEVGQEEGRWARQRDNFRSDLRTLYEEGYRLVSLRDYIAGAIDLPRGYSPVILTFDDSTAGQFRYLIHDGTLIVDPNSAVGILEQFCRAHPDFGNAATFYILPGRPFGQAALSDHKLRHIVSHGMDLGNHTWTHADLSRTSLPDTAYQLALPVDYVRRATEGYVMDTLALPYGAYPADRRILRTGEHNGIAYDNLAILLVGAEPAPSQFSRSFNPLFLPRVQGTDTEIQRWLGHFRTHPHDRYVSDGDPETIAFPASEQHRLNERAMDSRTPVALD